MKVIFMLLFVPVILIALLTFSLFFTGTYNKLVRLKALLDEAWSGVDVQLKRRYDLVPNLVATVKQYSIHEKSLLEEITRLRSASMSAHTVEEKSAAESGMTRALGTLFAVAEQYPNLKANENFLSLQQSLTDIEQEIQLARRYYNGTVRNYNIAVTTFPSNLIARLAQFKTAPYFEIAHAKERENPTVTF
jgi:LemA protein